MSTRRLQPLLARARSRTAISFPQPPSSSLPLTRHIHASDHSHAEKENGGQYIYRPPTSAYIPPATSNVSPSSSTSNRRSNSPPSPLFSSSGVPTDSHPMPESMPREDYATPAMYSLSLLARIMKYVLYGTVGLTVVTLAGVEGAHQYVERVSLGAPSHLSEEYDFLLEGVQDGGSGSSARAGDDEMDPVRSPQDYYSWAEENEAWTGGSAGGTSPLLGITARHSLRSAWIAQVLGTGSTMSSIGKEGNIGSGPAASMSKGMKGAIGANAGGVQNQTLNTIDTGYELAEAYIAQAIEKAHKASGRGSNPTIIFPDQLSVVRSITPSSERSSSVATRIEGREPSTKQQIKARRVGLDLLIRHAEILERMGTYSSLVRSVNNYERVLRALVDATPTVASSAEAGSTKLTRRQFARDVREAEILRLARKVGDVSSRMGDLDRAREWWLWGLGRGGIDVSAVARGVDSSKVDLVEQKGSVAAGSGKDTTGWGSRWFPSSKKENAVATSSRAGPINDVTSVVGAASWASSAIAPIKTRALISLLDSYSTHSALSGDLSAASTYQTQALALIDSDQSLAGSATSQPQRLHRAWLMSRKALLTLHLAEVTFARRQDVSSALGSLATATSLAENVVSTLTGVHGLAEDRHLPVQTVSLSTAFGEGQSTNELRHPSQLLLRDTQRANAEGWNLSGLLYERQASTSSPTSLAAVSNQEILEHALDCFEKAMGWGKISDGQDVRGQHDIHADEEPTGLMIGTKQEYWKNYARLKTKLEQGLRLA